MYRKRNTTLKYLLITLKWFRLPLILLEPLQSAQPTASLLFPLPPFLTHLPSSYHLRLSFCQPHLHCNLAPPTTTFSSPSKLPRFSSSILPFLQFIPFVQFLPYARINNPRNLFNEIGTIRLKSLLLIKARDSK